MNIFGGNTGLSYEDIQRKRAIADRLVAQNGAGTPRNVGEGLSAIGRALAARAIEKRTSRRMDELTAESDKLWQSIFSGGSTSPSPQTYAAAPPPDVTATPLTPNPAGLPQEIIGAVDKVDPLPAANKSPYADAIASVESAGSGDYKAVGPDTGKGRAYGRYQVMDFNIGPWTEKHLGRRLTPEQFLASPEAQDAVFNGEFGSYVEKYGNPQDAASVWFSGRPMREAGNASDGYNTVPQYVNKFNAALGGGGGGGGGGSVTPQRIASMQAITEAMGNPIIQKDPAKMAILNALIQKQLNPPTMTPYQQAQIELQRERMAADEAGAAEYGLTPQYITTPDGELQMIQLSKDGTAKVVDLPEGAAIQKGVEKLDVGTHYQWHNTITGEPIGDPIPKNLAEAESAKAAGKIAGETEAQAKVDIGLAEASSERLHTLIDSVIESPALAGITGMIQGRIPPLTQAGTDLNVKIDQLKGNAFMQAYEGLKGGGQITEVEGKKAEAAQLRLNRAQSTEEYIAALNEMKQLVDEVLNDTRKKAGQPVPQQQQKQPDESSEGVPTWNAEKGVWE